TGAATDGRDKPGHDAEETVCVIRFSPLPHTFSACHGNCHSSALHSLSASASEIASNSFSPFSLLAASGLPITPDAERAPIARQRYTPPPATLLTSGVMFTLANGMRSSATSSGRTAIIIA